MKSKILLISFIFVIAAIAGCSGNGGNDAASAPESTTSTTSEIAAVTQAVTRMLHDSQYGDWTDDYQTFNAESKRLISQNDFVQLMLKTSKTSGITSYNIDNISFIDTFAEPYTDTKYNHVAVVSISLTANNGFGQPVTLHQTLHFVNENGEWKGFFNPKDVS
ncbi:MAG: hypothetical protein ACYC0L_03070 [Thermoleophilia bacterium]